MAALKWLGAIFKRKDFEECTKHSGDEVKGGEVKGAASVDSERWEEVCSELASDTATVYDET